MRNGVFFLLLFLSLRLHATATGDSTHYLLPGDSVFLKLDVIGDKYFDHCIEAKQTLYSLAKFYGLSIEELYFYNPGLKEKTLKVGMNVSIPLPNRAIYRYQPKRYKEKDYIPVFYQVQKGETMYRISKTYFEMPVEDLQKRNGMTDHNVKTGQILHIGWMSINGVPDSLRRVHGGPLARRLNALKKLYLRENVNKKEVNQQGVAGWPKGSKESSDLYALHRTAPINSVIEVTNPMNSRTIHLIVIGRIPESAFEPDVKVVVSPLAADMLGVIDSRFFSRIKYHQ
ncbi:MAG TPA: LysM peptidoglycan-binding domain-containing protein [Saprospiraceae bacterium]|nr:LysM peptidoglycan-binding domain-containing protein [Saprospiraceae bacterium]HMQ84502.1 LysM peptidoglycan-binding domain-containing protein [Saprospiraceae bacterium]